MTTDGSESTRPTGLVGDYRPGESFLLSSPNGTLLGRGVAAMLPKTCAMASTDLTAEVSAFFAQARRFGRDSTLLAGAVPFDPNLPAHLVMPDTVTRSPGAPAARSAGRRPAPAALTTPGPQEYELAVRRALRRIEVGDLRAVTLGQACELTLDEPVDVAAVVNAVAGRDAGDRFVAVDLPRRGEDGSHDLFGTRPALRRTLLGATPGLLVSRTGRRVVSTPVTGFAPRSTDPAQDRERARELLDSTAQLREHERVVESFAEVLGPRCRSLHVPDPAVIRTAAGWQLSSELTGDLADLDVQSLELASALHSRAPVGGTPEDSARALIAESETVDRGYWGGLVGWCDATGDGEWVTVHPCVEIDGHTLRCFAGTEIVPGAEPEAVTAGTRALLEDLLLGLPG